MIQKSVELGAHAVVPLKLSRCVVRLDERTAAAKVARWQRIALEAAKQCGRAQAVEIRMPMELPALLKQKTHPLLVPYEQEKGTRMLQAMRQIDFERGCGIVIGPEGGLEAEEIDALQKAGAIPITLGRRILRAETASLAALTLAMHALDEL